MEKRITISGDLATLFVFHLAEENYGSFYPGLKRDDTYRYLISKGHLKTSDSTLSSTLTQLLILYDKIEIPFFYNTIFLKENAELFVEVTHDHTQWLEESSFEFIFPKEYFPIEPSLIKPMIVNGCVNKSSIPALCSYAERKIGSLQDLYSYMFDQFYNTEKLEINYDILNGLEYLFYYYNGGGYYGYKDEYEYLSYAVSEMKSCIEELAYYHYLSNKGPRDFYTPCFSSFHTATNTTDAYCIVKNQISMILDEQPAFDSLKDVIAFREKKYHDIANLRNEVSQLETLLKQGENEKAIKKAIIDVRNANQSLLKNTPAKKAARLATYLSVPIALLEMFLFGTSYSMIIGAVGTTAQLIADSNDAKNGWLFVAR